MTLKSNNGKRACKYSGIESTTPTDFLGRPALHKDKISELSNFGDRHDTTPQLYAFTHRHTCRAVHQRPATEWLQRKNEYLAVGGEKTTERSSTTTVNPGEYLCNAGKRFTVRVVDGGKSVWLILPEREVRLDKGETGNRYSSGNTLLELNGSAATLSDGTATTYVDCKIPDTAKSVK